MLFPDLYDALRAHKAAVILGTVLCVLATLLVTNAQPKYYQADAVVRIEPTDTESNPNDQYEAAQRLARTYAEVYARGAVTREINTLLAAPTATGTRARPVLKKELVAKQVKDLDMLAVGALTTDPQRSAQIANVGWRALDRLSDRDRLVLVTPATAPDTAASPNLKLNLALATFAGLILSVGLALILHAIRQPIPDAEGIERDFAVPVLATIPRLQFSRRPAASPPADAETAASPVPASPSRDDRSPSLLDGAGSGSATGSRRA